MVVFRVGRFNAWLTALVAGCIVVSPLGASTLTADYWAEGSKDGAGNYSYEAPPATQNGVQFVVIFRKVAAYRCHHG